ncbi:hypothetical protein DAPPUDRAFT_118505 [Daphnia pulex]|uniref:Uncharacterized protein n=1 Tax=Daphnia pulex TaxID=6669 RepID=E9HVT6_DAPPU|nr:hypothetical protein DAPPUDRAFT_118505 [Daphnia pulex]|eukprot:EFX64138.1 hypothetical protein DAPPUDRAFT_118505 [Daphnia pulex]
MAFGEIVTPSDQQEQRNVSRILVNLHAAQTVEGAGRLRFVYERSVKFEPTATVVETQAGTDDRDVHCNGCTRWVFKEERSCANVVEDLTEKGNEFQIAGPANEKKVEPYFFVLILGTTSSGREDKRRRELGGS